MLENIEIPSTQPVESPQPTDSNRREGLRALVTRAFSRERELRKLSPEAAAAARLVDTQRKLAKLDTEIIEEKELKRAGSAETWDNAQKSIAAIKQESEHARVQEEQRQVAALAHTKAKIATINELDRQANIKKTQRDPEALERLKELRSQ